MKLNKVLFYQGGSMRLGTEIVSSIVMYNYGVGPRVDPMNLAF